MTEEAQPNMDQIICVLLPTFNDGGAERVAVQLANLIVEHGRYVQVVVQYDEGPRRATLDSRVPVIVLGGRYRWLTFRMAHYLRRYRPVAVISFINWINIVAVVAAAMSGWRGRLIVSERSSLQGIRVKMGPWRAKLLLVSMKLLYGRANRIVAVSQQLARDFVSQMGLPAEKVIAIPNPVPTDEIRRAATIPVSHRFFHEGVPVLIAVGRLHSVKDYPILVEAVADLRLRRDVRLIILGEGPARAELEALVEFLGLSNVVDLPGYVSPPWPLMAHADVLVSSSRVEGWPNVLAEALALGIPVVATDCPTGPHEILDGGKFGRLVPVGDIGAMSAALEAILDNPPDRAALRSRADEWSPKRALELYLSCLQDQGTS